jgi:2-dehydro-3-deoxygluconokinase
MSDGVAVFGELLLRLDAPGHDRIEQAESFRTRYTGAEANAGVSLARFGHQVRAVSKVPNNAVGRACLQFLRQYGLETRDVIKGGPRLGLLYVESGASQRASTVTYDRSGSSFALSEPSDYKWASILDGVRWLHFTGTAPALGPGVRRGLQEGLEFAKSNGITVSCDLNYRASLWTPRQARSHMTPLMAYVDVLLGNEEDSEKMLGVAARGSDINTGVLSMEGHRRVLAEIAERYGVRVASTSLRESRSASENGWSGLITDGQDFFESRRYLISPIVDRIGAGDAFAGALIHGLLSGWNLQRVIDFATAASCLKHSIPGDFNLVSADEVETLVAGTSSGRVRR